MADNKKSKFVLCTSMGVFLLACVSLLGLQKIFMEKGLVTGKPGMNSYPEALPGETQILTRPYEGSPPFIPHSVADLTISRGGNDCIDCHFEEMEVDEGHVATKIPNSHFANLFTNETRTESVVGIRYNCLQCHVPQVEEEPPYVLKL